MITASDEPISNPVDCDECQGEGKIWTQIKPRSRSKALVECSRCDGSGKLCNYCGESVPACSCGECEDCK